MRLLKTFFAPMLVIAMIISCFGLNSYADPYIYASQSGDEWQTGAGELESTPSVEESTSPSPSSAESLPGTDENKSGGAGGVVIIIMAVIMALMLVVIVALSKALREKNSKLKNARTKQKDAESKRKDAELNVERMSAGKRIISDEEIRNSDLYKRCYKKGENYYTKCEELMQDNEGLRQSNEELQENVRKLKAQIRSLRQVSIDSESKADRSDAKKIDEKRKQEEFLHNEYKLCDLALVNGRVTICHGDFVYADLSNEDEVKVYPSKAVEERAVRSALASYFEFTGNGSNFECISPCVLRKTIYDYVVESKGKVRMS